MRVQVGVDQVAPTGEMHPQPRREEGFVTATFDLEACAQERAAWGVFRDRRPELYTPLMSLAGAKP